MIDLHVHSSASDGQYAPGELVDIVSLARSLDGERVDTFALTDHDTVAGVHEASLAAAKAGIRFIPGIELSCVTLQGGEAHVLGHFIDACHPELAKFSAAMKRERIRRMEKMVAAMNRLGVDVTLQEVSAYSQGESIGRTHLTRALMARGLVTGIEDAFEKFVGKGKPAYVPREKLPADEAIRLIRSIGGSVTLAHALASGVCPDEIRRLASRGLDGLEVWHPRHSEDQRKQLEALARETGLVPTAGSDFHGPSVAPSRHLGSVATPRESLTALEELARARKEGTGQGA